jgi:RNA polymerase sigma-70 factor (ECF subfamily)
MNDWERIVREHGPAVFATAWRILGHAAETEEVVQEVFQQAREATRGQEVPCTEVLLRRLAVGAALEQLRRRPAGEGREGGPVARLRAALALLPGCEAAVFSLRYFDDLSCEEIADTLLLNHSAVASALGHARMCLESLLRPPLPAPAGAPGAA